MGSRSATGRASTPRVTSVTRRASPRPATGGNSAGLFGRVATATRPINVPRPTSISPGGVEGTTPGMTSYGLVDNSRLPGVKFTDFASLPGVRKTDFSGMPAIPTTDYSQAPGVRKTNFGAMPGVRRTDFGMLPSVRRSQFSGADAFGDESQRMTDAMFQRAMNLRRPGDQRAQADLENKLWQRGLAPGSEAYNEEMNRLQQARDRSINDLSLGAVAAGSREHQRLADLDFRNQGANYAQDMGLRQQLAAEGQQRYGQDMGIRGLLGQEGQQRFGQDMAVRDQFGRETNQLYNQLMGYRGLLGNEGQQRYGQDLGLRQQFAGEGAQRFGETMGFRQQRAGEEQFNANLRAQLENMRFQNRLSAAGFNAGQNQLGFQNRMTARQEPFSQLAQISALAGMPSYAAPQYGAPDLMGMTGANYAARANQYGATMGGLMSAGGSLGAALLSDRRLKQNVKRVGTLDNGLPVYTYNVIGVPVTQMGVMADEAEKVVPEAVIERNGIKRVRYDLVA